MLTFALPLSLSLVLTPARTVGSRSAARASVQMAGDGVTFGNLDGSEARIGIIRARWHPEIGNALVEGAKKAMAECGVAPENIVETEVPGSFELPLAARFMALSGKVDAILPIGILIKGETYHFEAISDSVSSGLMSVGLQTGIPITFGVLTCMTEEQAKARSSGSDNHGEQWGKAAVEMALLRLSAVGPSSKKFFMGFGTGSASETKAAKPAERIGF